MYRCSPHTHFKMFYRQNDIRNIHHSSKIYLIVIHWSISVTDVDDMIIWDISSTSPIMHVQSSIEYICQSQNVRIHHMRCGLHWAVACLWTRQIWGIWKLRPAYMPETPNLGQNRWCFVPCDLEIWWMTLENNRAPLLCYLKLCATFQSHLCIQTGVTVRKRPIWVKFDDF